MDHNHDSGTAAPERTVIYIFVIASPESRKAIRVEDTSPGWEDLVPDVGEVSAAI